MHTFICAISQELNPSTHSTTAHNMETNSKRRKPKTLAIIISTKEHRALMANPTPATSTSDQATRVTIPLLPSPTLYYTAVT